MSNFPEAILPVSACTWQWLKRGKPAGLKFHHRFIYGWNAYWFDMNYRLQQQWLLNKEPLSCTDPVFILGLWRSGTTLIHELLSACPGFFAPTTRQCMNASTFAIAQPTKRDATTIVRPMDAMEISSESPQEDEFALLALGAPSVYRAFLDPSRLEEVETLLSPDYWAHQAPPTWKEDFLTFLRLVMQQATAGQRLVIKSPGHSFRIKAIEQIFPEARYIWLTRSPEEMFYSNRKMWNAMFKRYGLSECPTKKLERFLTSAFMQAADCLNWLCRNVGCDRLAVMDFSQFVTNAASAIAQAGKHLGLGEEAELHAACKVAMRHRTDYQREHYLSQSLSLEIKQAFQTLRTSHDQALASHGSYTLHA